MLVFRPFFLYNYGSDNMKYIEDINIDNKKVILRLDLNVTIKEGKIIDDTKIRESLKTINYLLERNARVLIMSHLGKVKTEEDKINNSLALVATRLETLLNKKVYFVNQTRGRKLEESLDNYNIVLMENTRYEDVPNKLESKCDLELSKYWASLGDVFINDAFGTTHRKHASNYGITKYIESGYGFLIQKELMGVSPVINDVVHPFAVIMGGAKVDDKIELIEKILKECDHILVGGGIANTFIKAKGYNIGSSLYSENFVEQVKKLITLYPEKICIPEDVLVHRGDKDLIVSITDVLDEDTIYDIGNKTIDKYLEILKNAKTIFANGTMGKYEDEVYANGTRALYKGLENIDAAKIAGGGDALASIKVLGYENSFTFLSTGGGAMLDYVANKRISCFEEE